jgi:hypothetical protein
VAARVDCDDFIRDTITAFERAGLVTGAHTLSIGTWPIQVWGEVVAESPLADDEEHRDNIVNARDHLVALLELYEVAFEWDAGASRVKVVGKDGWEVGATMKAPPSLRRRLNTQFEEEKRGWGGERFGDPES